LSNVRHEASPRFDHDQPRLRREAGVPVERDSTARPPHGP
jgi:hypothetical protein